jgi:hypothetical protein
MTSGEAGPFIVMAGPVPAIRGFLRSVSPCGNQGLAAGQGWLGNMSSRVSSPDSEKLP